MKDSNNKNLEQANSDIKEDQELFGERPFRIVKVIYLGAFVAIACYVWLSKFKIQCGKESSAPICGADTFPEFLGQFGDFFGGVLNPIVGLGTLYLISISIRIQRKELTATRIALEATTSEIEKQTRQATFQNQQSAVRNFENTFFTWLENYKSLVGSFNCSYGSRVNGIKTSLDKAMEQSVKASSEARRTPGDLTRNIFLEGVKDSWRSLNHGFQDQLCPITNTLTELLRWIDSEEQLSNSKKEFYFGIVRAQLSQTEFKLVYFHGYCDKDENLKLICEKYGFFRDIDKKDHAINYLREISDSLPDHYNPSAFTAPSA